MSLVLECEEDDLTDSQNVFYNDIKKKRLDFLKKIEEIIASRNGQIISKGEYVTVYQLNHLVTYTTAATTVPQPVDSTSSQRTGLISKLLSSPDVSIQNNASALLSSIINRSCLENSDVAPRTRQLLLLRQVRKHQPGVADISMSQSSSFRINHSDTTLITDPALNINVNVPGISPTDPSVKPLLLVTTARRSETDTRSSKKPFETNVPGREREKSGHVVIPTFTVDDKIIRSSTNSLSSSLNTDVISTDYLSTTLPDISVGVRNIPKFTSNITSLTPFAITEIRQKDDLLKNERKVESERFSEGKERKNNLESRAISLIASSDEWFKTNSKFYTLYLRTQCAISSNTEEPDMSKVSSVNFPDKIFPSLLIRVRPCLNVTISPKNDAKERSCLGTKMRYILLKSPRELIEWLIRTGMIATNVVCNTHVNQDNRPNKMAIGIFPNFERFPHSGGYIRVSTCCDEKFISIFQNSIFENYPHSPLVLVKLINHWICNFDVKYIKTLVEIEEVYLRNFFTDLRAISIAAVHEHIGILGGPDKTVEVGILRLGTTSLSDHSKRIIVDIIGVLDCETKNIRFRALDTQSNDSHDGFFNIVKYVETLVHKESVILLDRRFEKSAFTRLGYKNIGRLCTRMVADDDIIIMNYMRKKLSGMFQNSLAALNARLIQQFLDELSWRECWGLTPSKGFNNILAHIAKQTELVSSFGQSLCKVLAEISKDPFRNWNYSMWKSNCNFDKDSKKIIVNDFTAEFQSKHEVIPLYTNSVMQNRVDDLSIDSLKPLLTPLDTYYYGEMPADNLVIRKLLKIKLNVECYVCNNTYDNNIVLMNHLFDHALNETEEAVITSHRCKYCLKNFTTTQTLEEHIYQEHTLSPVSIRCLICEKEFTDRVLLIVHMQSIHDESEFPYRCVICKYQTSEHRKVIDHFYDVHNFANKLQCPFCLKILQVAPNKTKQAITMQFFVAHIQNHRKNPDILKCDKCILTFVRKICFEQHKKKDHNSCGALAGMLRYPQSPNGTLMPIPTTSSSQEIITVGLITTAYTMSKLSHVNHPLKPNSVCFECSGVINHTEHFSFYLLCMRCSYATCCKIAMDEHVDKIHRRNISCTTKPDENKSILYCACHFSNSDHDECARHWVTCQYKILYTSAELAADSLIPIKSAVRSTINLRSSDDDSETHSDTNTQNAEVDNVKRNSDYLIKSDDNLVPDVKRRKKFTNNIEVEQMPVRSTT